MITRWLPILLVLLIAVQSLSVAADVHGWHQASDAHQAFERDDVIAHLLIPRDQPGLQETTPEPTSVDDCQRCFYCLGTCFGLLFAAPLLVHSSQPPTLPHYCASLTSVDPTALFRPPKG